MYERFIDNEKLLTCRGHETPATLQGSKIPKAPANPILFNRQKYRVKGRKIQLEKDLVCCSHKIPPRPDGHGKGSDPCGGSRPAPLAAL